MDFFEWRASKEKKQLSYPTSKMRVWTKPEPKPKEEEITVEESTASDSMIMRVIKKWKGED